MNGKGSTRRPSSVSKDEWRKRWELVFAGKALVEWIDLDEAGRLYPHTSRAKRR